MSEPYRSTACLKECHDDCDVVACRCFCHGRVDEKEEEENDIF